MIVQTLDQKKVRRWLRPKKELQNSITLIIDLYYWYSTHNAMLVEPILQMLLEIVRLWTMGLPHM